MEYMGYRLLRLMILSNATLTVTLVGCTKPAGRINVLLRVQFRGDIGSTTRERGFKVAFVKLLWPLFTHVIQTIGNYVLWQLIYIYSRPTSSQCSLLTHKSSVCNPAFVLQKEINCYHYTGEFRQITRSVFLLLPDQVPTQLSNTAPQWESPGAWSRSSGANGNNNEQVKTAQCRE